MKTKILLVDDEGSALAAYQRILHKQFDVHLATGSPEALKVLRSQGPFAVVVTDMYMPGMSGLELLSHIRDLDPDITRIMITGDAEQKTAADAVNQGQVFRFLSKPCSPEALIDAIEAGIHQYELLHIEKEVMEQTLSGAVGVMIELFSSLDPQAFGVATLLRDRALRVAQHLELDRDWEIGLSVLLSPIGRLTIAPRVAQKVQIGQPLTVEERSLLERAPEFGARLLRRIPRLEGVAEAVRFQNRCFDGSGFPEDGPSGTHIPLASRILKPLSDMLKFEHQALSPLSALEKLKAQAHLYDPEILTAIVAITEVDLGLRGGQARTSLALPLTELREGQILASHVMTATGKLVLFPGIRLSAGHIQLLQNLAELLDLQEPVLIQDNSPS
jgi:response regulator RpfG family c-di-GMP phosphodiesterase